MDSLLTRYRNLTVLLAVLLAQWVLLGYQVKTNQEVRLIRVWAISGVTPLARVLEGVRSGTAHLMEKYLFLVNVKEQDLALKTEFARLKMENQFLKRELGTAERAEALLAFQARTPSRTVAARIIGTGAGGNIKVVILDRGTNAGVKRGMAVLTSDGVVGRVVEVYPAASTVLLLTDASFAAGVVSQKNRVSGILRGTGRGTCAIDYVPNEQKVESGEWFYTTGDDRVFPRGLPVGTVTTVQPGRIFKDVVLAPSGLSKGLEEVLVVLEGVHQSVPEYVQEPASVVSLLPPPPGEQTQVPGSSPGGEGAALGTEADRLREQYRRIGEAQGHVFGEGSPGSKPPDFNLKPGAQPGPTPAPRSAGAPSKGVAPTAPPGAVKPSQTAPPQRPPAP